MTDQVKLESDLAAACQEIDRLHKELSEAKYGCDGQAAIKSLIKVLEWYADPVNYELKPISPERGSGVIEPVELDKGTRARIALSEVKL